MTDTRITDDGLQHLSVLKTLLYLHLNSPEITDDGLQHLKRLTNLEELSLDGTRVTNAGVKMLQHALADCDIE